MSTKSGADSAKLLPPMAGQPINTTESFDDKQEGHGENQQQLVLPFAAKTPWLAMTPAARSFRWFADPMAWTIPQGNNFQSKLLRNALGCIEVIETNLRYTAERLFKSKDTGHPSEERHGVVSPFARAAFCRLGTSPGLLKKDDSERWLHNILHTAVTDRAAFFASPQQTAKFDVMPGTLFFDGETLLKLRTKGAIKLCDAERYWPQHMVKLLDAIAGMSMAQLQKQQALRRQEVNSNTSPAESLLRGIRDGKSSVAVGYLMSNLCGAALGLKALSLVS